MGIIDTSNLGGTASEMSLDLRSDVSHKSSSGVHVVYV